MKTANLGTKNPEFGCKIAGITDQDTMDAKSPLDKISLLQRQANLIIKELNSFLTRQGQIIVISNENINVAGISTISNFLRSYSTKFITDGLSMKSQLCQLTQKITQLSFSVTKVQATPQCLQRLKSCMEDIDISVNEMRNSQRIEYEQLQMSEQNLWQEILSYQRRYGVWQKTEQFETSLKKFTVQSSKTKLNTQEDDSSLHPDVKTFDEFLFETGGHTGGWDIIDHQTFIRMRKKYKSDNVYTSFEEYIKPYLPIQTIEEIKIHIDWYEQYLKLHRNKKDVIKKWRIEKKKVKKTVINLNNINNNCSNQNLAKFKAINDSASNKMEETKSKLIEWKLEKSQKMAIKIVEEKEEKAKKELERQMEKIKNDRIRIKVEDFIAKKEEIKHEEEILERVKQTEIKDKAQIANREILRFLARDHEVMNDQREKQRAIQQQEDKKSQRLESLRNSVRIEGVRNRERLYQKTKGWISREKIKSIERRETNTSRDITISDPVMKLGTHRLAIPAWRQNI